MLSGERPADRANDYMVERYVRFTHSLDEAASGAVRSSIERHLDAAAVERFYRQFYAIYDACDDAPSPRVQSFVDGLFEQ